ncbi:hypothetical protein [Streptomyces sp. TS71-3]|uniref:CTP synthase C-terminal region-related (seleno)protein n=1 Tax=Streptomyces sp. TS71-3 TaxID=2733862 RepID=UPI001B069FD1|nr:hypothetical protein [Streptomyces sp. TS71-3]GHJ41015.1 hypothetical protein Sm713_66240 [Streptomyces sp. TS71-3]
MTETRKNPGPGPTPPAAPRRTADVPDERARSSGTRASPPAVAAAPDGPRGPARLALVGDRSPNVRSHTRIPLLLEALAVRDRIVLDAYWVPTEDAEAEGAVSGFDAVWVLPGSPYRSEAGALAAIRTARTEGIPLLGTCAGFQHVLLEYARAVCGLASAAHGESDPDAEDLLIGPLACSLVGHEGAVVLGPGTLAESVLGVDRSIERYHCAYGPVSHLDTLQQHGLVFSGADEEGQVRIVELPGHPFFLATLFQPELAGDGSSPHPLVRALARAAAAHAAGAPAVGDAA